MRVGIQGLRRIGVKGLKGIGFKGDRVFAKVYIRVYNFLAKAILRLR